MAGLRTGSYDFVLACARSLKTVYANTHAPVDAILGNGRAVQGIVSLIEQSGVCAQVGANLIAKYAGRPPFCSPLEFARTRLLWPRPPSKGAGAPSRRPPPCKHAPWPNNAH